MSFLLGIPYLNSKDFITSLKTFNCLPMYNSNVLFGLNYSVFSSDSSNMDFVLKISQNLTFVNNQNSNFASMSRLLSHLLYAVQKSLITFREYIENSIKTNYLPSILITIIYIKQNVEN